MATNKELLEALDQLAESVEAMYAEAAMLRHEVRVVDEKRARMWLPIALMVVVGVIVIYVALQNRNNSRILVECTTPGPNHECYQRGQDAQEKFFSVLDEQAEEIRNLRSETSELKSEIRELRAGVPVTEVPSSSQPPPAPSDSGDTVVIVPDEDPPPSPPTTNTTTTTQPCGRLEVSSRCPLM